MNRSVLVLGAGVNGLSCALTLLEAGYEVTVRAERRTPHTTSDRAGAVFYPIAIEPDRGRIVEWSRRSLPVFRQLAEDAESGVGWIDFVEYFSEPVGDFWWGSVGIPLRRSEPLPGYVDALLARTPRIDMPVYLRYLERRVEAAGGRIEQRRVGSLQEITGYPVIVACIGLGARGLLGDEAVFPIRGQVLHVPWTDDLRVLEGRGLLDDSGPNAMAYVIPRHDRLVLGGTHDVNDWSEDADAATSAAIVERCAAVEPRLAGVRGQAVVGLRPGRGTVRLELERIDDITVIHDYGHGPLGVTLSWGCAQEVRRLAETL